MSRPTHLQPKAQLTADGHAVTRQGGPVPGRPGAVAAVVRYDDQLQAEGADLDAEAALREALAAHGA